MRRLFTLSLASLVLAGCAGPVPQPDPQQAWVDLRMLSGRVVMAESLDTRRLNNGRFFQVPPGAHSLLVRYDFDVYGGGGSMFGWMSSERLCYLTVNYAGFAAGQRYRLETQTLGLQPFARLYDSAGKVVAEDSDVNCLL